MKQMADYLYAGSLKISPNGKLALREEIPRAAHHLIIAAGRKPDPNCSTKQEGYDFITLFLIRQAEM